jgi:hypothetical protein
LAVAELWASSVEPVKVSPAAISAASFCKEVVFINSSFFQYNTDRSRGLRFFLFDT